MFPTYEFQKSKEYLILLTVDKEMNKIPHILSKQNTIQRAEELTNFDTKMLHKFRSPCKFSHP